MATAKTTTNTPTNVRGKLALARLKFLQRNIKKSGKNMHLEYKYYELTDIVPAATEIFAEVGLVSTTEFDGEKAIMTVYNTDSIDEPGITFVAPYREVEQIVSKTGSVVTNTMQALGSSITYLRRYLYMMMLDIVEQDDIDAVIGSTDNELTTATRKAPATVEERKAAKEDLVSADKEASEAEISELKSLCKTLISKDEDNEEFVQQIALKTEGFTKIQSSACKELCKNLSEMVKEYE